MGAIYSGVLARYWGGLDLPYVPKGWWETHGSYELYIQDSSVSGVNKFAYNSYAVLNSGIKIKLSSMSIGNICDLRTEVEGCHLVKVGDTGDVVL